MFKLIFIGLIGVAIGALFLLLSNDRYVDFSERTFSELVAHPSNMYEREIVDVSLDGCRLIWTHVPAKDPNRAPVFGAFIVDLDTLSPKPTFYGSSDDISRAFWMDETYEISGFSEINDTRSVRTTREINNLEAAAEKGVYEYTTISPGKSVLHNVNSIGFSLPDNSISIVISMIMQAREDCRI